MEMYEFVEEFMDGARGPPFNQREWKIRLF